MNSLTPKSAYLRRPSMFIQELSKNEHLRRPSMFFQEVRVEKPKSEKIKSLCYDFSRSTSSHGIPQIGIAKSKKKFYFWTIVFAFCLIVFITQAFIMVEKYLRFEKTVQVELKFKSAAFPTVTVCNLNPFKNQLVNKIDTIRKTLKSYNKAMANAESSTRNAGMTRLKRASEPNADFTYKIGFTRCDCRRESEGGCSPLENIIPSFASPANTTETNRSNTDWHEETMCYCIFDPEKEIAWPCYDVSQWHGTSCNLCSKRGICQEMDGKPGANSADSGAFSVFLRGLESTKHMPCLCQQVSSFCMAFPYGSAPVNLWEVFDEQAFEEAQGFQGMTDEVAITTKAKENLIFTTSALSIEQKRGLSYEKHEFVRMCSFNSRQCDVDRDFVVHVDPVYGNCYTFNHNSSSNLRKSDRAGPYYGLRLLTYVDLSTYMPTTEAAGVRIVVHDGQDIPYPDSFGFSAPTGFISSFGLHLTSIDRLPRPYGSCDPDGVSTEGCHRRCFQRQLIKICGCGDPRLPFISGEDYCSYDDSKGRACLDQAIKDLGGLQAELECECIHPCQQHVYTVAFSASTWPAESYQIRECNDTQEVCVAMYKKNAALIEVYFEQLNYEKLTERPAYEWVNLLADFGGQLGLWLGVGIISCVEFLVFGWDFLSLWFRNGSIEEKTHSYCPTCNTPMKDGTTKCNLCRTPTPSPWSTPTRVESEPDLLKTRGVTLKLTPDTMAQYLQTCNAEQCTGCLICRSSSNFV